MEQKIRIINFVFIGCVISSHEDTLVYQTFLTQIKDNLKKHFNFDWKPHFGVSDAAESLNSAMQNVFGEMDHIRCFFHVVKTIRDKVFRWKVLSERKLLKDSWGFIHYGIKTMHKMQTDEDFLNIWNFVKADWKSKQLPDLFTEYLEKKFVNNRKKLRSNRLETLRINMTNNGLERLHRDLKETYTQKKKMQLNEFILQAQRFIRDYSIDHKDDFLKPFEATNEFWRKAQNLLRDDQNERGPFYDIREGYALFIKKKKNIDLFEQRRK